MLPNFSLIEFFIGLSEMIAMSKKKENIDIMQVIYYGFKKKENIDIMQIIYYGFHVYVGVLCTFCQFSSTSLQFFA